MATGPPRLPPRQLPPSTFWQEIREERWLERAVQREKQAFFRELLLEADRTGDYDAFWRAMRNQE